MRISSYRRFKRASKLRQQGCLEHSFAMYEALLNAKHNQRQIVVAWLDLCNAYGSVRHNLVQFVLEWYHVPEFIRVLILNYYDKICADPHKEVDLRNIPPISVCFKGAFSLVSCLIVFFNSY